MANETNTLSQIDSIRREINKKLGNAKIEDAFNLMEKNIALLDMSIDDINLLKANYTNSKNQFEQGIIDKDKFDKIFTRTVRGIQSMLKIDYNAELSVSQNIQNQEVKKTKNRGFLWFLLPVIAILLALSYTYLYDTLTEKLTLKKFENYFEQLSDPDVNREEKNKIIDDISKKNFGKIVAIKGAKDNLIDEKEISDFLIELKYGNYNNISVEDITDNLIIVKYRN